MTTIDPSVSGVGGGGGHWEDVSLSAFSPDSETIYRYWYSDEPFVYKGALDIDHIQCSVAPNLSSATAKLMHTEYSLSHRTFVRWRIDLTFPSGSGSLSEASYKIIQTGGTPSKIEKWVPDS